MEGADALAVEAHVLGEGAGAQDLQPYLVFRRKGG